MNFTENPIIKDDINKIISAIDNWTYFSGKTILVTGANGFIPSYIIYTLCGLNDLLQKPMTIIALVRNRTKAEDKFKSLISYPNFKLIVSDVSDAKLKEHVDIIIHAASQASPKYYGKDPVGTLKANTIGTYNMLEQAVQQKAEKFLYFSSGEVYGVSYENMPKIKEDNTGNVDITDVRSCYAESKRMGENMCVCFSHQFNIHTNMIRLSHIYGPGISLDDGRVFADFANRAVHNKNIVLNSDGSAKRGFLYITDMVIAMFQILLNAPTCEVYNISAESQTSILELAKIICEIYPEKELKIEFNQTRDKNYIRSKSTSVELSNRKIKQLGWEQTIYVREGFKRMIDSYSY